MTNMSWHGTRARAAGSRRDGLLKQVERRLRDDEVLVELAREAPGGAWIVRVSGTTTDELLVCRDEREARETYAGMIGTLEDDGFREVITEAA